MRHAASRLTSYEGTGRPSTDMEGNGEISDTDSGIILHSGSDSPTTHTKDVTTHTRAIKIKHQELQEKLEMCIHELRKLCIREAELTGRLSEDYPLQPGEKAPQVHRRVGAAFKLDELKIPRGAEDSKLSSVDASLALQMKIYEAARKLCEEENLSKSVRKSRLQQCKREEKKLKHLQETAFSLRLEHGRSSPLPALSITQQDLGTSDDSSLCDSVVQDEEVTSQSSQPSSGLPYPAETDPPQLLPLSTQSCMDGAYISPCVTPQSLQLNLSHSPHPSVDLSFTSRPAYDLPPIEHSPWAESSLDQPYQKSKKSHSSVKMSSPAKPESLPPLEACLAQLALPVQLSHLKLSRTQSNSTPSTPEMRVHRQLSLRLSSPDSAFEKERGRPRGPRRRLTEYSITLPETPSPTLNYRSHASSEGSNSENSFPSYNSSPCRELPGDLPKQFPSAFLLPSPVGSYGPQAFPHAGFYRNPRQQPSPGIPKAYYNEELIYNEMDMPRSYFPQQAPCSSNRYDYRYKDTAVPHQRVQRPFAPDIRITPPANWDHPHCHANGLPRQAVNEQLKSWHRRSQQRAPRSRSLDRQGAVRMKNVLVGESPCYQTQQYHEQVIQRGTLHRAAEGAQGRWFGEDASHFYSQV
ncbi:innate immunity activator b isoform X1 [Neolamprologus brichardi]|uniref:innate immunity activator b isoform X1 n=2 Tax=Neolamprologus brichardi TaxID=32507 RepID=UPI0003EBF4EA|nr:innate immunity activator b isoform X1 [Neolamprologus brichardi]XP_035761116.1 innate immunity activator b isoform X1 [Neolamprologus brichardi]XP_035761117.1 innate immunity activator b isoform X1 [Neolamprologus brichardi]